MTNPLTEGRTYVAEALASTGLNVYAYTQDGPDLPAAWVTPDPEWAVPITLTATKVGLVVTVALGAATRSRDAIGALEDWVWKAYRALTDKGVRVVSIDSPVTATHNTLNVHQVPMHVVVHVDDEGA
jgi:hypothetical protein